MSRTIHLKSYDLYAEILEYTLPEGKFTILQRDKVEARGIPLNFGAFCREGEQVAGIFASPGGPVLFLDSQHIVGRYGQTSAIVQDLPGQSQKRFTLIHKDAATGHTTELSLVYEKRIGLGANPYDNEEEDIDLLAMIAANLGHEAFFRAYTKDWTDYGV